MSVRSDFGPLQVTEVLALLLPHQVTKEATKMFAKRARGWATFIALTMVFMLRAGAQAQDLARSDSTASAASATKKSDVKSDTKGD